MPDGAPQKPLRAARRHAREQRSSRRPMRLVQLVLAIAENTDVGLSQDELLAHQRLTALYSAHASAAYQAFADDIKELTGQSLIGMRTQPASTALIRYDATTKHFHLAQPLHVLHLNGPTLAALQALLTALQDGAVLPGGKELCERLLALVPPDQLPALVTPTASQTLHLDIGVAALDASTEHIAQTLLHARRDRRTIEFAYHAPRRPQPTHHNGDEVIGIYIGQHPYATVWCTTAQRELDLRLERFVAGSLHLLPTTVNPRVRQGIAVQYWLAPHLAESATTIHLEQQHASYAEDGIGVIVSGMARNLFWAQRLLLGYGEHARALSPPQLVAAMQQTISAMAARYANDASQVVLGKDGMIP